MSQDDKDGVFVKKKKKNGIEKDVKVVSKALVVS